MRIYTDIKRIMKFKEEQDNYDEEIITNCAVRLKSGKAYGGGYYNTLNNKYDDEFELEDDGCGQTFKVQDIETLIIFD